MSYKITNTPFSSIKELFMVLETLKAYARNPYTAICQKDILDYIEKDFDYKIRRERIALIINQYNSLSGDPRFSLRYTIICLNKKKKRRFYINTKGMLKEEDIANISSAISNSSLESKERSKLNTSFLKLANKDLEYSPYQQSFISQIRQKFIDTGHNMDDVSDQAIWDKYKHLYKN